MRKMSVSPICVQPSIALFGWLAPFLAEGSIESEELKPMKGQSDSGFRLCKS